MALPDLVAAKKTQRDKDWPMIRRLVDVNYLSHRDEPTPEQIRFWLRELRTPELLVEVAQAHADVAEEFAGARPLLKLATQRISRAALSAGRYAMRKTQSGAWTRRIGSPCESRSSAFAGLGARDRGGGRRLAHDRRTTPRSVILTA